MNQEDNTMNKFIEALCTIEDRDDVIIEVKNGKLIIQIDVHFEEGWKGTYGSTV